MSIDPTAILAELAAIQADVRTLANAASITRYSPTMSDLGDRTLKRIGLLMSSIAAPPAVDNGMLAPIRARLDRMEREIAKLDERIERDRFDLDRRVTRLEARIDGGDPGDEQETRHG